MPYEDDYKMWLEKMLVDEPQTCYTCEYEWRDGTDEPCVYCYGGSKYKPKDEPQTEKCDRPQMDCENCWKELHCRVKDEPQTEREGE